MSPEKKQSGGRGVAINTQEVCRLVLPGVWVSGRDSFTAGGGGGSASLHFESGILIDSELQKIFSFGNIPKHSETFAIPKHSLDTGEGWVVIWSWFACHTRSPCLIKAIQVEGGREYRLSPHHAHNT